MARRRSGSPLRKLTALRCTAVFRDCGSSVKRTAKLHPLWQMRRPLWSLWQRSRLQYGQCWAHMTRWKLIVESGEEKRVNARTGWVVPEARALLLQPDFVMSIAGGGLPRVVGSAAEACRRRHLTKGGPTPVAEYRHPRPSAPRSMSCCVRSQRPRARREREGVTVPLLRDDRPCNLGHAHQNLSRRPQ